MSWPTPLSRGARPNLTSQMGSWDGRAREPLIGNGGWALVRWRASLDAVEGRRSRRTARQVQVAPKPRPRRRCQTPFRAGSVRRRAGRALARGSAEGR